MAGDTTDIREIATRWKRQTRNPELLALCEQAAPFDLIRLEDQPTKSSTGAGAIVLSACCVLPRHMLIVSKTSLNSARKVLRRADRGH